MIVNIWVTLDPKGDRPYVSTSPPTTLARLPGMQVFLVEVFIPDPVPVDGVLQATGLLQEKVPTP